MFLKLLLLASFNVVLAFARLYFNSAHLSFSCSFYLPVCLFTQFHLLILCKKYVKTSFLHINSLHKPSSSCFASARRGSVPFPRKEDGTLLYDDTDYKLTWVAMEKLVEKGLVRSIGLSNFNRKQIDDILSVARIKPTVLQVRSVCDDDDDDGGGWTVDLR